KPVELDQASVGRLSRMDALQGQAMAKAVEQRRLDEISRINAALRRLAEGEYGACANCGENVSEGRLRLDPSVAVCLDCARGR
ncbi:MAG: TraR/DksA C4-type zinc finger protein, partial [Pseudomonadota bacterium]